MIPPGLREAMSSTSAKSSKMLQSDKSWEKVSEKTEGKKDEVGMAKTETKKDDVGMSKTDTKKEA